MFKVVSFFEELGGFADAKKRFQAPSETPAPKVNITFASVIAFEDYNVTLHFLTL